MAGHHLGHDDLQLFEFIKLAMILMLAQRLSQSEHPMSTFRDFIEIMAMLLVPCAIVLFSGETGSAIVVVFAFACMLLFANVRWRLLITMAVVAILLFWRCTASWSPRAAMTTVWHVLSHS